MSDWALGKKLNSQIADVPLNHLIWLNDYKTYGEASYVFNNKDILHELYRSPIAVNDKKISGEAIDYIVGTDQGVGTAFSHIYGIDSAQLRKLSSMNDIAESSSARAAVIGSALAYNVVANSTAAIAKFVVAAAGLNPSEYADMSVVADSAVAIGAIATSEEAKTLVLNSSAALAALNASSLATTASSNFAVNGKGFVISYSVKAVETTYSTATSWGGYNVTLDDTVLANCEPYGSSFSSEATVPAAKGSYLFFTTNLSFTLRTNSTTYRTGTGSIKYILGA